MKTIIIPGFLAAGLALCSFAASADEKYPAADFQPKVVFIDQAAAAASGSSTASTKCPGQTVAAKQTEFDPKYPAASFAPKVLYPN